MQPIYFHTETLTWLRDHQPWPPSLYQDLDAVAKHNAKVEAINTH